MRQNIRLYINNTLADCEIDSLILMNYTQDDLKNPAIVRNSFSQSVTLPSSPANNALFGAFWRLDKQVISNGFNPLKKAPFSLLNERNEVIASGYAKLDSIERTGRTIYAYKVSLYGGLGSFFYSLSYDGEGEKRTLGSLRYAHDLGFIINRSNILNAWNALANGTAGMWQDINFAPCYNGLPDDFSTDKALVSAPNTELGIVGSYNGVNAHNGFVLASLEDDFNEWQMRDLRSYLQRPALRIKALFNAISNPANNGGYNVVLDPRFFNADNPDYERAWLTLPQLTANEYAQTFSRRIETDFDTDIDEGWHEGTILWEDMRGTSAGNFTLRPSSYEGASFRNGGMFIAVAKAYDASGMAWISRAQVFAASGTDLSRARQICEAHGLNVSGYDLIAGSFGSDGMFSASASLSYSELQNISYINVDFYCEDMLTAPISYATIWASGNGTLSVSAVRSGAIISQSQLFAGTDTPAQYLLDYCKIFGLNFHEDAATKTITIYSDAGFFDGQTIDLSMRIDRSRELSILPTAAKSHWYILEAQTEGAKAEQYAKQYGQTYGKMRINTGWDFDAEETDMIPDNAIRGAVQVLAQGVQYTDAVVGSSFRRYWQTLGYSLKYGIGDASEEMESPAFRPSGFSSFNPDFEFADAMDKPQFCDEDDKGIEGAGVLLYFGGMQTLTKAVAVTDDTDEMLLQNDNEPCWLIGGGDVRTTIPHFSRFWANGSRLERTLDFALAKELYTPIYTSRADGCGVYDRYWAKYAQDRYDVDTRVVTCWADLRGMKVDGELLRHFYWFDNAVWLLNRIINHSITTHDLTECEFIKIKDKQNYIG